MRDAVQDLLLPLEQQAMARRAADHLVDAADPTDGQLRQAAAMYELAGYPNQAAQQLIRAARVAVATPHWTSPSTILPRPALTGTVPEAAQEVLIERIDTLTLGGSRGDAYHSGIDCPEQPAGRDARRLLVATRGPLTAPACTQRPRCCWSARDSDEVDDADLAVLRHTQRWLTGGPRQSPWANTPQRCPGARPLRCRLRSLAGRRPRRQETRHRPSCTRLAPGLVVERGAPPPRWQVRTLAELGMFDRRRFGSHPVLAGPGTGAAAGMVGMVARDGHADRRNHRYRKGWVAAYPASRADAQARALQLTGLYAPTRLTSHNALSMPTPSVAGPYRFVSPVGSR